MVMEWSYNLIIRQLVIIMVMVRVRINAVIRMRRLSAPVAIRHPYLVAIPPVQHPVTQCHLLNIYRNMIKAKIGKTKTNKQKKRKNRPSHLSSQNLKLFFLTINLEIGKPMAMGMNVPGNLKSKTTGDYSPTWWSLWPLVVFGRSSSECEP